MNQFNRQILWAGLVLILVGCAAVRNRKTEVYPFSYDHTYDRVIEAAGLLGNWSLTQADYRHGILKLRSEGVYFPERSVEIRLQSVDSSSTQVEFRGTGVPLLKKEFFKKINQEFVIDSVQAA